MSKCLHYKYTFHVHRHFLASTVKMASAETPHYELFDEEKNIMIYGIKIEELFSEGCTISSDTLDVIHQMIPDVVDKCINSHYGKKAIVLYTAGVMEVVQMR